MHALVAQLVVIGRAAEILRGNFLQLAFASLAPAKFARVIACVVWLPTERHDHGTPFPVSPQVTSTFSHGHRQHFRATRARSISEWVPRLPTPVCTYSFPSGRSVIKLSNPIDPAPCGPTATPTPRTFAPRRWPEYAFRSSHRNVCLPFVERLVDERARQALTLAVGLRGPKHRAPHRRVDLPDFDLIDAELLRGLGDEWLDHPLACIGPGDRC
jgi:hypothetical protein